NRSTPIACSTRRRSTSSPIWAPGISGAPSSAKAASGPPSWPAIEGRAMERPVAGVMAIVRKHGQFLLVRRSKAPDAGRWSFPAGKIERGETLGEAALRELSEETGIVARFGKVLTAVDAIEYDAGGDLRFHFVIVAARCDWQAGDPQPGDDALEARWFT